MFDQVYVQLANIDALSAGKLCDDVARYWSASRSNT